ncbi:hypothetical protein [Mucilaginibacter arboris]|uniref:Uncharacterized protein n=1 Tax=Mucilaginibacter arboris TaxID=2682090 RepID=A0A7K1SZD1_9SPHI|nr:hypothetical protein [Mucilaginibacter arboris]MVN22669.1 hypothetical protein [Mucilaginibacter arboris]
MKHLLISLLAVLLMILFAFACNNTSEIDSKKTELIQKEKELLKRENELLQKEKELDKPLLKQTHQPATITESQNNNKKVDNLDYLKKLNGKYPYEVKLFNNSALTRRLKSLLGSRYKFFKDTWVVETPIKISNNNFIASGCQQHNCGNTNFIIVVDFLKDIVYAGIREEGTVKVYSEDESNNAEINRWANDN